MRSPVAARPPTFRWQALLILLPVGLLTLAGFWALRQDRRLVEQDARERAGQALETLGAKVAQALPFALVAPELRDLAAIDDRRADDFGLVARWDREGRSRFPRDYEDPPLPPSWWCELSPAQRAAWDALMQACSKEAVPAERDDALAAWTATSPSEAAQIAARFRWLQAKATEADAAAGEQLWRFACEHPEATGPSGLPLAVTAAGALLNHPEADSRRPLLLAALRACAIDSPSLLTPILLERTLEAARGATNVPVGEIMLLSRSWQSQERLRQLARALAVKSPELLGPETAWVEGNDGEYLASFGLDRSAEGPASTNQADAAETVAWFLPRLVVERALGRVLDYRGDGGLPFAGLEVSVAGRRVVPAGLPAPEGSATARALVLAEVAVAVDRLAAWHRDEAGGGGWRRQADDFHPLPAAIPFELTLRLARPDVLYARQTQRAWLLGGLIAVAAGAALVGLAGAHRAFRRQLRLAELKSNFVSSVSHELRAPIASVRLLAESLERGKILEETRRQEYFRLIGRECRRLSGLIDNVLDFSRIDQGRKRYEFEPTDFTALVGETVRLMEPYAAERRVRLAFTAPSPSIELVADGRALQQALVNLVDNAIKHSPAGSRVRIELTVSERAVRWSVTDCGPGIPSEDRERIFEPFFRRGSELRRETQGAGIGLSIVRHVVDAHHGRVSVQSSPGQGACFTVEIPFASDSHES